MSSNGKRIPGELSDLPPWVDPKTPEDVEIGASYWRKKIRLRDPANAEEFDAFVETIKDACVYMGKLKRQSLRLRRRYVKELQQEIIIGKRLKRSPGAQYQTLWF